MTEDYIPKDLEDLIRVIQNERSHFESLIAELSESDLLEPGVEGDWSIKDLMVHISAWEKLAYDRIHATITGDPLTYPVIQSDEFVDSFNRDAYIANKDLPLNEVTADFRKSYDGFLNQIKNLNNEILFKKLPFDWAGDLTAQVVISANTHWHYLEHAKSILKWMEK
jgi:hypothetical protein